MVKKCPTCGANNRDDAAFCSACGASTTTTAAPSAAPSVKPVPSVRVVSPMAPSAAPMAAPMRVPAPGMCYYHPNLPAVYVCNRCGRAICRDDAKSHLTLILCPQCHTHVYPRSPTPVYQPALAYPPTPRAVFW